MELKNTPSGHAEGAILQPLATDRHLSFRNQLALESRLLNHSINSKYPLKTSREELFLMFHHVSMAPEASRRARLEELGPREVFAEASGAAGELFGARNASSSRIWVAESSRTPRLKLFS